MDTLSPRDTDQGQHPDRPRAVVTLALIIANVVVYLLTVVHGGSLWSGPDAREVLRYGVVVHALTHGTAPANAISPGQPCSPRCSSTARCSSWP